MWPATPAPPNMPTPFPARLAESATSALASATSCRISVETSRLISPTRLPTLWSVCLASVCL
jgi:hypothetical protein